MSADSAPKEAMMRHVEQELRSNASSATVGDQVRARRRSLGLTQRDLADLADVGVRLVHEIEHDALTVQVGNLVRVLNALGLHLQLAPGASRHVVATPSSRT